MLARVLACIASCSGRPGRARCRPGSRRSSVLETDHEVLVLVALPGVDPDRVEAAIDGNDLVFAGTRIYPSELRTAIIHRLELPQGRFERRARLPGGRYSAVRRSAADGCLLIRLQKSEAFRG